MNPANGARAAPKLKKVMVFYDGTWCGQLTGTVTNVKILADTIAGRSVNARERFESTRGDGKIVGCYFDGEGVEGHFSDYLLDGALGGRIRQDCLEAYKFLMEEFEQADGECEAWLIGLSRGSYTVRCVAGMINNCGLISKKVITERFGATPSDPDMESILQRTYGYYRNRAEQFLPNSSFMQKWKRRHSRNTQRPPVKFMGLFETVGALGIPSLSPGTGVDYLESLNFYGKADEGASAVSGEVERAYQALAVHDRLTAFTPSHIKRDKHAKDFSYNDGSTNSNLKFKYETEELWFPGAHYDIGRQKFMFYKSPALFTPDLKQLKIRALLHEFWKRLVQRSGSFFITRLYRIPDIIPNYEYSAAVLIWVAKKMALTDPDAFGTLPDEVKTSATTVEPTSRKETFFNRVTFKPSPLYNDAYDHLIKKRYLTLPFEHRFLVGFMDRYFLMDRTIVDPPPGAPPVRFHDATQLSHVDPPPGAPPVRFHDATQLSHVDLDVELKASKDYRSRSYNSYVFDKKIMGSSARAPV